MPELIQNLHKTEDGQEGKVYFTLFDKYIDLFSSEAVSDDYVLKCAQYLNSIDAQITQHLCEASIRYCNDFLYNIGEKIRKLDRSQDILTIIDPRSLNIPDPEGRDVPVINLELNCEWEEEHGMEWIIREDKVLYVGAYNGENPWADFESEDNWNYA